MKPSSSTSSSPTDRDSSPTDRDSSPTDRKLAPFRLSSSCTASVLVALWSIAAAGQIPAQSGASPHLLAGLTALEQSQYSTAQRELEPLSRSGAERGPALLGLARVQLGTGRYEEAGRTAHLAGQADAGISPDAAAVEAEAIARTGKTAEAIALLEPLRSDAKARRARLLLGQLYLQTGRKALANDPLMSIIEDYNQNRVGKGDREGLALVGRAAQLLGSARDANDAYNEAEKAGKHRLETLLFRAELFLDKYDPGHAEEVVQEALQIAPYSAQAHVAMAHVKLDQALDFRTAEHEVELAMKTDPRIKGAFFVAAGLALRTMDLGRADDVLRRGLAANPGDLELLSLRAAMSFLADDRTSFENTKKIVFGKNPEFARFFEIVGEFAEWEHRYDEIVAMMREAVTIDPDDAKAWAELGLNAIRGGDETGGISALRRAWQKDKFNVRVYNTLNLYEKQIATSYETVDSQPFRIRYHKEERPELARYVPGLLSEAWTTFVRRYAIAPQPPITIELYADTEQFSVRTSGLPHAGIQGVCFGRTVAAPSPRAQSVNWGNVLWHELAHVFALQLSKNHVPRWFTEGLSEYETILRHPEWGREEDPGLYLALKHGRLPSVLHFNEAFTQAQEADDVTVAYYAASQLQVCLAESYGPTKVVSMLKEWGAGRKTPEVIERALGITVAELDVRFRQWLERKLARYDAQFVPDDHAPPLDKAQANVKAAPGSARAHVELAIALGKAKRIEEANRALDQALSIDPLEPDALFVRAGLFRAQGNRDAARELLLRLVTQGSDGYTVRMALAGLAADRNDVAAAELDWKIAHDFDASMVQPVLALGDAAVRSNRRDDALLWLTKAAALDQHDRKVHGMLLAGLVEARRFKEAVQAGEAALFVDVENPKVHSLYATALSETGDHSRAVFELESALLLPSPPPEQAALHARLAKEHLVLGHASKARSERDEALRLDPSNSVAKSLRVP